MFSKTLKDSLDIIEVASRYLPDLKSAGRTFKSNCPFHEERTPSFVIFPSKFLIEFFIEYAHCKISILLS